MKKFNHTEEELQELSEQYIVIEFETENGEKDFRLTNRSHFEEGNFCEVYGNFGQQSGCYGAGCYSLDNSESDFSSDLLKAIDNEFGTSLIDAEIGSYFYSIEDLKSEIENKEIDFNEDIEKFANNWVKENEHHTEATFWTFWDGSNHKSITILTEHGEYCDAKEADDETSMSIIDQYPGQFHIEGTEEVEETEDYSYRETRWSDDPWLAHVTEREE